jgi:uncharacterized protein YjbI with pentapeptide repeats
MDKADEVTRDHRQRYLRMKGKDIIAQWADEGTVPDLSNCDLDLVDFSNCNLDYVNFTNSSLVGAKFHYSDLSNAVFHNTDIRWADFHSAKMICTDFGGKTLATKASFTWALFEDVSIKDTRFDYCDFSHATLRRVAIHGSAFNSANFYGAKISGVDFSGMWVKYADFREARLHDVKFIGTDLFGARFDSASLCLNRDMERAIVSRDFVYRLLVVLSGLRCKNEDEELAKLMSAIKSVTNKSEQCKQIFEEMSEKPLQQYQHDKPDTRSDEILRFINEKYGSDK